MIIVHELFNYDELNYCTTFFISGIMNIIIINIIYYYTILYT